jgi:hypothetical protein
MSSAAAAGISHGHTSANEDLVIHFGVVAGCRRQRSSVRQLSWPSGLAGNGPCGQVCQVVAEGA